MVSNTSPTSITTTFFSTNPSFSKNNVTTKNKSIQSYDSQSYLNDISKTLFASDNTSTQTPTIQKKVRCNFILSKNILSSRQDKNNTFDESIFVCSECSNGDANNQHSSTINDLTPIMILKVTSVTIVIATIHWIILSYTKYNYHP